MRSISWLHLSDIHMSVRDAWSQDVVLRAMCERIEKLPTQGVAPDFILATGDLAFSGNSEEYKLVGDFFDAVCKASGVPKKRMFCVPGNHDIDRSRQKLCFKGARSSLVNPQVVDAVLTPDDDLGTLLEREESYRCFQKKYFGKQERVSTRDGLAYVCRFSIEDIQFAIVGLDSAWVAEGGLGDRGNLLIGERQAINAFELTQAGKDPPHIVISMAHHPCHFLQEFDRAPVQGRIERASQFFHCGHLHLPETRVVGQSGTGCVVLAAGASYETRQSQNSFSVITIDLLNAERRVQTINYEPKDGTFSSESWQKFEFEVAARDTCNVGELAAELCAYRSELEDHATYLAALLLDQKAELPIPTNEGYVFGSFAVLVNQRSTTLRESTVRFMAFRNVLRALYGRSPMQDILARYGGTIGEYGALLGELGEHDAPLRQRLADQEREASSLAGVEPRGSFAHSMKLLDELAAGNEWEELVTYSRRLVDSPHEKLSMHARRMSALGLARSGTDAGRLQAIEIYRGLGDRPDALPTDFGNLAVLLLDADDADGAKDTVIRAMRVCPETQMNYLSQIGHRIIESTGDRAFRKQMEDALVKRGKGD